MLLTMAVAGLGATSLANAAAGTWTNLAGGIWSDAETTNWSGGTVADGASNNANFNTLNITNDPTTVSLGASRTIGSLTFGDTNTASIAGWVLDNGGSSSNILTLAGGTPTITVNTLGTAKVTTISAEIAGTAGLTKAGAGTLVLTGVNNYSGGTTVTAGSLGFTALSAFGADPITLNGGGLRWETGSTVDISTRTITIGASGGSLNTNGNNVSLANGIGNSGTGRLTKSGTGTLALNAASTNTGGVTIGGGTLAINHAGALGTGSLTLAATSAFANTSGSAITLSTNNAQSWAGDWTFASGSSALDMGTGTITLNKGSSLFLTISSSLTLGGVIQNGTTNVWQKSGTGTLTLSGASTFSGGLSASSGRLNINNGGDATSSAVGTGRLSIGNDVQIGNTSGSNIVLGTNNLLTLSGNYVYQGPNDLNLGTGDVTIGGAVSSRTWTVAAGTLTIGGNMSETNAGNNILKIGTGSLVLSGTSTFTGTTGVRVGTLVAGSNVPASGSGAFGNASSTIALGSGSATADSVALLTNGAFEIGRPISVGSANATGTSSIGGINPASTTSTYSGAVTLSRSAILTSLNAGATTNFSGLINDGAGTFALTINGGANAGTVRLSNSTGNTYDGTTTVATGTLLVNNVSGSGTGTGAVSVTGGTLGGTGIIQGAVTVAGTLAPGAHETLTLNNGVTFTAGALKIDLASDASYDIVELAGGNATLGSQVATLNLTSSYEPADGTKFWIIDNLAAGTLSGRFTGLPNSGDIAGTIGSTQYAIYYGADHSTGNLTGGNDVALVAVVPEPASIAALGTLALGMLSRRRRMN